MKITFNRVNYNGRFYYINRALGGLEYAPCREGFFAAIEQVLGLKDGTLTTDIKQFKFDVRKRDPKLPNFHECLVEYNEVNIGDQCYELPTSFMDRHDLSDGDSLWIYVENPLEKKTEEIVLDLAYEEGGGYSGDLKGTRIALCKNGLSNALGNPSLPDENISLLISKEKGDAMFSYRKCTCGCNGVHIFAGDTSLVSSFTGYGSIPKVLGLNEGDKFFVTILNKPEKKSLKLNLRRGMCDYYVDGNISATINNKIYSALFFCGSGIDAAFHTNEDNINIEISPAKAGDKGTIVERRDADYFYIRDTKVFSTTLDSGRLANDLCNLWNTNYLKVEVVK
jgi:hypothetical protein